MSLLTNLFRLIPPSLRRDYCPLDYQQLANDIVSGTQVTLLINKGSFIYNYGQSTPAAENRIFPWFNTTLKRWYHFDNGFWLAPHPTAAGPNGFRLIWTGEENGNANGLWVIDEGDGTDPSSASDAPTSTAGSFWAVDHTFDGRTAIGVGALPGSDPAISIALGQSLGAASHLLTAEEGGARSHSHKFGASNPASDDAFFAMGGNQTGLSYTGFYVTGGGAHNVSPQTTADLETLQNTVADIVSHSILNPAKGVFFIKRTARLYYRLPA